MKTENIDTVSVNLSGIEREALNRIKKKYGIEADAKALRFCINSIDCYFELDKQRRPEPDKFKAWCALQDYDMADYNALYGNEQD